MLGICQLFLARAELVRERRVARLPQLLRGLLQLSLVFGEPFLERSLLRGAEVGVRAQAHKGLRSMIR